MAHEQSPSTKIGILTVSDRAFGGEYEDRGGPAVVAYIKDHFQPSETILRVVPDEQPKIEQVIRELAAECSLVLTTGGTGPAPRDVTPEATIAVCEKLLPGFGEVMRAASFPKVPTAILSRQTAGVCGTTVVVNLPGSPKAISECLDPILQALPHATRLAGASNPPTLLPEFHVKGRMCTECQVVH